MVHRSHALTVFLVAAITVGAPGDSSAVRQRGASGDKKLDVGKLVAAGRGFVAAGRGLVARHLRWTGWRTKVVPGEKKLDGGKPLPARRDVVARQPTRNGRQGQVAPPEKKLDMGKLVAAGRGYVARHLWWPGGGKEGVAGNEQPKIDGARNSGRGVVNNGRGVAGHPRQNGQRRQPVGKANKLDVDKRIRAARSFLARHFTIGGWRLQGISDGIAGVAAFPAWSDQTKSAVGEMGAVLERMLRKTTSIGVAPMDGVQPGEVDWTMYELRGKGGRLVGRAGIGQSTVQTPSFGTYMTDNSVQYYVADAKSDARYLLDESAFRRTPQSSLRPAVQVVSCLRSGRGGYRVNVVGGLTHGRHLDNEVEHYAVAEMARNAAQADRLLTSQGISEIFQRAQARKEGRRWRR